MTVCPSCHAPASSLPKRGRDARCQDCRDALPVNGNPDTAVWKKANRKEAA